MRLAAAEDGSSLIEFALLLPMMLSVLVGLTDYGLWAQKTMQLQAAADAGAI